MQTKEMKGITLVALVVTIVVLLILAGVSINLIIRDGGIFELTNKTSKETSKASVKEKIQLEAIDSIKYENLGIFDIDLFEDNLNKKLGIAEDKIIENEENIIVRTDGYKITVNKDGQVENIEDDDGIDNTKQPNTEYKNRTIEENYNAISGLTKKLFDYGYSNYMTKKLREKDAIATSIDVTGGTKETKNLDLLLSNDITAVISQNVSDESYEPEIKLEDHISAPIYQGQILGKIVYNIDGIEYSADLKAAHNVDISSFFKLAIQTVLVILILYFLYLLLFDDSKNKKYRKKFKKNSYKM